MKSRKTFTHISVKLLAALFIFLGFGMIHGATQIVEKLGSILIGIGTLYFIIILVISIYFSENNT